MITKNVVVYIIVHLFAAFRRNGISRGSDVSSVWWRTKRVRAFYANVHKIWNENDFSVHKALRAIRVLTWKYNIICAYIILYVRVRVGLKFIDLKLIMRFRRKVLRRGDGGGCASVRAPRHGEASRGGRGKTSFNDRIACPGAVSQIWQAPRTYLTAVRPRPQQRAL